MLERSPQEIEPNKKETEDNPEFVRIKKALEWVESSVNEHPLVAQSVIDVFERISLKRAQDKGVDISQIPDFEVRVEALKKKAPVVEISESLRRAEEFDKTGDIVGAKSWWADADSKIRSLENNLSQEDLEHYMERLKKMSHLWE